MDDIIDNPEEKTEVLDYASFWIRVGAFLIDEIILTFIIVCIFAGLFGAQLIEDWKSFKDIITTEKFAYFTYATATIRALYFIIMESTAKQATFGKMAVGIVVGKEYGERISLLNAFGRYIAKDFFILLLSFPLLSNMSMLFYFLYAAGFLLAIWDKQKQALHDKMAGTYVFLKK